MILNLVGIPNTTSTLLFRRPVTTVAQVKALTPGKVKLTEKFRSETEKTNITQNSGHWDGEEWSKNVTNSELNFSRSMR